MTAELARIFAVTGGATLAAMALLWLASLRRDDVGIVDIYWGPGFAAIAWLALAAADQAGPRDWLLAGLVTLWGGRLGLHLHRRNHGKPEDKRYAAMRAARGPAFRWRSLYVVFGLQAAIMWIVALPLQAAPAAPGAAGLPAPALAGTAVFCVGLAFEAAGDRQLARFRADPANRGRVLDTGLWAWSRHPNYFGDAVVWWGLYLVAAEPGGWWTAVGPVLMTFLLLRVSGVPLLEADLRASKPGYDRYIARTSAFLPRPPSHRSRGTTRSGPPI